MEGRDDDFMEDDEASEVSKNYSVETTNDGELENDGDEMGEDSNGHESDAGQVLLHSLKTLMEQNHIIMETLVKKTKRKGHWKYLTTTMTMTKWI